jgi:hypothetical protein
VWHLSLMTVREFDCGGATDIWFAEEDLAPGEFLIKRNLSGAWLNADVLLRYGGPGGGEPQVFHVAVSWTASGPKTISVTRERQPTGSTRTVVIERPAAVVAEPMVRGEVSEGSLRAGTVLSHPHQHP